MSNIIRLNETAPNNGWIVMSNQGMDCFLDLLITAADVVPVLRKDVLRNVIKQKTQNVHRHY